MHNQLNPSDANSLTDLSTNLRPLISTIHYAKRKWTYNLLKLLMERTIAHYESVSNLYLWLDFTFPPKGKGKGKHLHLRNMSKEMIACLVESEELLRELRF